MLKLSCSKLFHNPLSYACSANIEEVLKFFNLGDETDFKFSAAKAVFPKLLKPLTNTALFWSCLEPNRIQAKTLIMIPHKAVRAGTT